MGCGSGGWVQMGFGLEFAMGLILRWISGWVFSFGFKFCGFLFCGFCFDFCCGSSIGS